MTLLDSLTFRPRECIRRTSYFIQQTSAYAQLSLRRPVEIPIGIVVVGRNDDYMPDFLSRVRVTLRWNLKHVAQEAIFVEWNPPPGRELLASQLAREFSQLTAYVVPNEVHQAVAKDSRLPLLEYHAKNVGLRRAQSRWIISTNADALFAPDTILALRDTPLTEEIAWTAERIDIPWETGRSSDPSLPDLVRYRRVIPYDDLGTGEFLLAARTRWHAAGGFDEALVRHRMGCDKRGAEQLRWGGVKLQRIGRVLHMAHPTSCTEASGPHQGQYAGTSSGPYHNSEDWGLAEHREVELGERVWLLS